MLEFNTPIKKKNYYVVIPKNKLRINVINCKILDINRMNENILEVKLYINNEQIAKMLNNVEQESIDLIKKKNKEWFSNELTADDIDDLYAYKYDNQSSILELYIHESHYPKIYVGDTKCSDIEEVLSMVDQNTYELNIDIRYLGIFIQKEMFYNKWIITDIEFERIEDIDIEGEIEYEWTLEIDKANKLIDDTIARLQDKKVYINNVFMENPRRTGWEESLRSCIDSVSCIKLNL